MLKQRPESSGTCKFAVGGMLLRRAPSTPRGVRRISLVEAAVAACLLISRTGMAANAPPGNDVVSDATASGLAGNQLQEVTVTAQRRVQDVQDVPIAVQAVTSVQLQN